jgi:hypothetical protein
MPTLSNFKKDPSETPGELNFSFDTNLTDGTGRLYAICSLSPTKPDTDQLRAGLDGDGNAAVWKQNKAPAAQAEQSFTADGLEGDGVPRYYPWAAHLEN